MRRRAIKCYPTPLALPFFLRHLDLSLHPASIPSSLSVSLPPISTIISQFHLSFDIIQLLTGCCC